MIKGLSKLGTEGNIISLNRGVYLKTKTKQKKHLKQTSYLMVKNWMFSLWDGEQGKNSILLIPSQYCTSKQAGNKARKANKKCTYYKGGNKIVPFTDKIIIDADNPK